MSRKLMVLLLVVAGCGDKKIEVAVYDGLHGATIANMAASGIRQSQVAKDRRFAARPVAQHAIVGDSLTPEILTAALDSVINDTLVVALLSRFYAQAAVEATSKLNQAGMPYLAIHPVDPRLTGGSTNGFSLVPDIEKEAAFIARQLGGGQRIAVVHIDDTYGRSMGAALARAITAAGSTPFWVRSYQQSWDEPRMVALGHETRSARPDALVFAGRSPSLTLVMQPFREAGEEIRVIGTDLVESQATYNNADGSLVGVQFVRFMDPQAQDERTRDLAGRYTFWVGFGEITTEGILIYDGMYLIGEAIRAGARTRAQVSAYLRSLGRTRPPFSGVSGLIEFGDDGQVPRKLELVQVQQRGVTVVATDSAAGRR
jgi:ABC-type branched-subunit amino acid transport system substrate-binding protein